MPNAFRSTWAGLEPLWLVYWVYGVLGGNVLAYLFEKVSEVLPAFAVFSSRGTVVLTVAMVPWSLWSGFHGGT